MASFWWQTVPSTIDSALFQCEIPWNAFFLLSTLPSFPSRLLKRSVGWLWNRSVRWLNKRSVHWLRKRNVRWLVHLNALHTITFELLNGIAEQIKLMDEESVQFLFQVFYGAFSHLFFIHRLFTFFLCVGPFLETKMKQFANIFSLVAITNRRLIKS